VFHEEKRASVRRRRVRPLRLRVHGAEKAKPAAKPKGEPIKAKIGVISIITGQGAAYGEAITNGIKLARDEVNAKGEVFVDLKVEDSSGKQEQALAAAQKLINSEKVVAIIGPTLSNEMFAAGPEANASGVPIMGTSTTAKGIPQIGKFVFRNSMPESQAIPASVGHAVKKYNIKKVALLYGNDDAFTKSGFDTMKEVAEKLKLNIVTIQEFQKGQADYKAQLTKIASLKPDAVLCSALYNEGGVILGPGAEDGIESPVRRGERLQLPQGHRDRQGGGRGADRCDPWFGDKDDPMVKAFVAKYEKAYGKKPDQFAAQAYDAFYIMTNALKEAGAADRAKLRDSLAATRNFQGVVGKFSFDADRDVVMTPSVLIVKGGKFAIFN